MILITITTPASGMDDGKNPGHPKQLIAPSHNWNGLEW